MSTTWMGEMVDLLCYGFDAQENALTALAEYLLFRQQENTRQAVAYMQQQGLTLSLETLPDLLAVPSAAQPHAIIPWVVGQGIRLEDPGVKNILRGAGITLETNPPAAVVEAAHRSGGVCILAHPGHTEGFVTFDVDRLDRFRQEAPVDGLEVYHPVNSPAQRETYREYARRHHLLVSAGSDSHRPDNPPIPYRAELCRDLLERVGFRVN